MPKNTIRVVRVARLPKSAIHRGTWGSCYTCGAGVTTGTGHVVGSYLFCDDCWNGPTDQPITTSILQNAPVQGRQVG